MGHRYETDDEDARGDGRQQDPLDTHRGSLPIRVS
jgi:hypothetical protein